MKRYALAGAGVRGMCYAKAIVELFPHVAELSAIYDNNPIRAKGFCEILGQDIPCYTDFRKMVAERGPQSLIICTPDHTHDGMVELAFSNGLDAITEKPMAIGEAAVKRIFDLEREHDRKVRVTFNVRYATHPARLKELLRTENIGPVTSVTLNWFVDRVHGGEYFHRWHAEMANSSGLLVHKSTHHFDLVNWLLEDTPESVAALGSLQVYGAKGPFRSARCRGCPHGKECQFYYDMASWDQETRDRVNKLYLNAEGVDGYVRDACVFRKEIDIYDTMSVLVSYRGGAQLNYSLAAYAPREGFRLTLVGVKGAVEAEEFAPDSIGRIRVIKGTTRKNITVRNVELQPDAGDGHGGGDLRIYRHLFEENVPDPLGQAAGSRDGANSCLIGICANRAIQTKSVVRIPDVGQEART